MKRKVLVIEDNSDNLRLITYVLERAAYEVISAVSGEEGVEIAGREQPFFILMDIQLPGINGLETTRKIRSLETDRTIPIIALTSFALRGDRDNALKAGCNGYIEKPIDPLTIMETIEKLLGDKACVS